MDTPLTPRELKALVTRRRMVEAAYGLFCERGYPGTTIAAVAQRARVAVPTVYYTFGTKAKLLDEAIGAAVVGFEHWREPPTEPTVEDLLPWNWWWEQFDTAPTALTALEVFVTNGVEILERMAPLTSAMRGAGGDRDAAEVVRVGEVRRAKTYRTVVRVIAAKPGGLRSGLTRQAATDVLVALFSADLYNSIRHGRGWSAERTAELLQRLLAAELLDEH